MRAAATSSVGQIPLQNSFKSVVARAPVAFGLIIASGIVFLLFWELGLVELVHLLNFVPFDETPFGRSYGEPGQDFWRFVTPTLLHFGWMHIVFNSLWVWEFGRRIESRLGSINLFGLYVAAAIFSNSVQYFVTGGSIFGGMSGVVYAFLGFIWAGNMVRPRWIEPLPPAIFGFMLAWLIIGMVGALEILGVGAIANGAHLGGLIIGVILGGVFGQLSKLARH